MRNKLRSSKVVLSVYISSCQNRKLHEETLPLCISLMPCTWIWKQKVSLIIQSNWLFPYTVLLQNFCQTVSLVHAQKKRTTTQFVIWQAINTIHQWEMWCEVDQCPGSCKLWQKLQLFCFTSHLQMSQLSLRLNNLRTVLKFVQKPGFQME